MARLKLATTWLGGCSGCHMSFLDMDEWLLDLAAKADYVFGPVVDTKVFPEDVDITLIEGSVCNEDNLEMVHTIRKRSKIVVSFGDCAVTGNVTAMRDNLKKDPKTAVLQRSYIELATLQPEIPSDTGVLPQLLDKILPVHQVIPVDYYIPGCPPPADRIRKVLEAFLQGQEPQRESMDIKFG